jgi:hypothetical protein
MCAVVAVTATVLPSAASAAPATNKFELIPNDFGFDQHSSPAIVTPDGDWRAITDNGTDVFHYGTVNDVPAVYNSGDGLAKPGVFRPSTGQWFLGDTLGDTQEVVHYGGSRDLPVQAHYRGIDKPTVLATFRPSVGNWYLRGIGAYDFGARGDIPVPGHYRNAVATDYADTIAVFRPSNSTWFIRGIENVQYGKRGDTPAPADYNGDGTTDIAVFRPSNGTWFVRGQGAQKWGTAGDIPVTGDYNGDGRADYAVYRPSNGYLYIRGGGAVQLGTGGMPIGAAPYHD